MEIALISAAFGAALGVFLSYWLERHRQRQVARAQIAIHLRRWMEGVLSQIYDIQTWVGSNGLGGNLYSKLPKFGFEKSLDQVALLEYAMAMRVFKLILKKDDANTEALAAKEYEDDEVAVDMYRNRAAQLWFRALRIYDRIATQLKWSDRAFSDEKRTMVQEEIDRFQKLANKRAKDQREFLKDT
jgi:hypothetical protein